MSTRAINKACLQKPRTQTPQYIPSAYTPHVVIKPAKQYMDAFKSNIESARKLAEFVREEEKQIASRYNRS